MKTLSVVFPGQGSQYAGMSKVLLEHFPWTKALYEEASDATHENLQKMTLEGPEEALQLTRNSQPAILVTSYCWFEALRRELDFKPSAGAGHSLGEYTALLAAGAMTLPVAAKLVQKRGELMQTAVPEGKGKMAALLGLEDEKVVALCQAASRPGSVVVPANFNSPGQVVISGAREAVERAETLTATPEFKARKCIPLKVSAPFHSPLMEAIAEPFSKELKAVAWKPLAFPVAFNVDAKLREQADIVALLTTQLYSPVQWTGCATALAQRVGKSFVEVGPGKVLTGLIKRIVEAPAVTGIDSLEDFKAFEKLWREN